MLPAAFLTDLLGIVAAPDTETCFARLAGAAQIHGGAPAFSVIYHDDATGGFQLGHSTTPDAAAWAGRVTDVLPDWLEKMWSQFSGPVTMSNPRGLAMPPIGSAPLIYEGSPFGMLLLHGPAGHAMTQEQERRLPHLAAAAAAALIKLQLYEAANREALASTAKIRAVNETGELLKSLDLDTLLVKLLELSLRIVSAQVGSIALAEGEALVTAVEWGLRDEALQALRTPDGEAFAARVLAGGQPVLIRDAAADPLLDPASLPGSVKSLAAIPLMTQNRRVGLITIVNGEGEVAETDFAILGTISSLAANAVENAILVKDRLASERIREQMEIARAIHASLLPRQAPDLPRFSIAGWSLPCDETGGDYFDYIPLPDGRVLFVIGDASGHGLPAALIMLTVRASLLTLMGAAADLQAAMAVVNNRVEKDTEADKYMTLFCGLLDPARRALHYCSGGHDSPLWIRAGGEVEMLEATGVPVGIMPDADFELSGERQFAPGDILILGTDGIWEARNGRDEEYSKERLVRIVREHAAEDAAAIARHLQDDIRAFIRDHVQLDDITLVVIQAL